MNKLNKVLNSKSTNKILAITQYIIALNKPIKPYDMSTFKDF